MITRGLGWKPDTDDYLREAPRLGEVYRAQKYGVARPPPEHREQVKHCSIRDQIGTNACVGFTIAGAALTRLRYLGFTPSRFSDLAPYAIARQLEGKYKNKPLPDTGSYPFLAMNGVQMFGLVPDKVWPFGADYLERVHQEVDFHVFQKASQFRVSHFGRIDARGAARVDACMRAIASGHPIPLGMQVGREFNDYRKGRGPVGVEEGPTTGGHMTFLCGYEDNGEVFIGCNSWGRDYGEEGFFRIHRSKLEHATTTDLYDFIITETKRTP